MLKRSTEVIFLSVGLILLLTSPSANTNALDDSILDEEISSSISKQQSSFAFINHHQRIKNLTPINFRKIKYLKLRKCTQNRRYWGHHPRGQYLLKKLLNKGLTLGENFYSTKDIKEILTTPIKGNALKSLALRLIASSLNKLAGADSSEIDQQIKEAHRLIGNSMIPPVGSDHVLPGSRKGWRMLDIKDVLDDYNNGYLSIPKCRLDEAYNKLEMIDLSVFR